MVGRYQAYKEFKPSGVEWLGDVPKHWDVSTRIKYISSLKGRLGWQGLKADEYIEDGPYVVSSAHFSEHKIQWDKCPHVSLERYELDSNIQLAEGDLLLMKDGAAMGKLAYVDDLPDKACLNSHLLLFRPQISQEEPSYDARFMYYFVQTDFFQGYIKVNGTGATFLGISQQAIGNFQLVIPSLVEQSQISAFLDHETAKIDDLIAKQLRLIALLEEKRQAVISHAVTKGLNPNAPMRPSGIDWLGDVPAHWEVKPFKYLCLDAVGIQMGPFGGMLTNLEERNTGYKLFGQENTIKADFNIGDRYVSAARFQELSRYKLEPGDLVLTRKGSIGNCQIFPKDGPQGIADSDTIRVKLTKSLAFPPFIRLCLSEAGFVGAQLELNKRGAILSGLNTSVIANLQFVLPELDEQIQIFNWVKAKSESFSKGAAAAQCAITLLQERRKALISAAVTGKIDVRDWRPPVDAETPQGEAA